MTLLPLHFFVIKFFFSLFRIYLLKQVVRNHGLDALKKIVEIKNLSWILPESLRQTEVIISPNLFYLERRLNCTYSL